MTVLSVKEGNASPSAFDVVCEVSSASNVRLFVADNELLTGATVFGPVTPTGYASYGTKYTAKISASGLDASTRYYFGVEHAGTLDAAHRGTILTFPTPNSPASFTIGMSGDSGLTPTTPGVGAVLASTRLSNHQIHSDIADRAKTENWLAFIHMGDEHYYDLSTNNHGIVGGASLENFRRADSDVGLQPNCEKLWRSVNRIKLVDDHDFLGNDSDGSSNIPGREAWAQVYREREPHYPLVESGAPYFSTLIGRCLLVVTDSRYYSSPDLAADDETKTMWGAAQKAWLLQELATTAAEFVILITSRQWTRTFGEDTWSVFDTERQELIQLFDGLNWSGRMCMTYADRHAFHLQKQDHQFGGFPILLAAPLDASGGSPLLDYPDGIPDDPGPSHSQYGTISIEDNGEAITVTMTGWRGDAQLGSHTFTVFTPGPTIVPNRQVMQELTSGSHAVSFEARVVEFYQEGDDPTGTEIPIVGGDVNMDATADIFASLNLTTAGEMAGKLLWPQRATDLLAPFGNEVFVRRGVQVDGQVIWVPLGYFRIGTPQQANAPEGEISITGLDRMAGIIIARLLSPRSFLSNRTVHSVFDELVHEVYPAATILFDDPLVEFAQIGRLIEVEESRYDTLRELADSYGKIMYWDTSGILRIESAPDPQTPLWTFAAGRRNGVLIQASRTLSSEGVYNCLVVTGEGASDEVEPVRAVVVDNNPNSPTYFYGKFGPVPKFYSSPLITTEAQATLAGTSMLRRSLGFPYNVDFTISPNPAVRPWDPTRIMFKGGKLEIHVIDQIKIPLDAQTAMTGRTKEQTLMAIEELT